MICLRQVIRQSGADIVGLNEVNGRGAGADYLPQAEILAERLGFHAYFAQAIAFDGVNPYGNALLSRYSIETARPFSYRIRRHADMPGIMRRAVC